MLSPLNSIQHSFEAFERFDTKPSSGRGNASASFRRRCGAFTLVELLVVIVIISICLALCIPFYRSIIERSQGMACASNMRQLGVALNLFRGEHNGWFPPGYPSASNAIPAANAQPGMPPQPGAIDFTGYLVPAYISGLPVCPGLRLSPADMKKYPDYKARLQQLGGGYGINGILLQWKVEAMPWPYWPATGKYSTAHMPFLLEVCPTKVNVTWAFIHQFQALNGIPGYALGRSHGSGDTLNFMFLDGHIEAISRNDPRDVPDDQKTWIYPTNPNGKFQAWGSGGRHIQHLQLADPQFKALYPQYYPPN